MDYIDNRRKPSCISCLKNFRCFEGGEDYTFTQEALTEILYSMVKIIDRKISKEMAEAGREYILHDGWTKCSIHFVCYMHAT